MKKKVHIFVSPLYFDRIFEPNRKKLASQLGLDKLSQPDFTEYIAKKNLGLGLLGFGKARKRRNGK